MWRPVLILTATAALAACSAGAVSPSPGTGLDSSYASAPHGSGATAASAATGSATNRNKALRQCRRITKSAKRRACVKRVNDRYSEPQAPADTAPAAVIDVRDKYFSPDVVNIAKGDSILWVWNSLNKDAHNVNLASGPSGVNRSDFGTPSSPSLGFTFKRTFTVPGTYQFVCSIHYLMKMQVEVSR